MLFDRHVPASFAPVGVSGTDAGGGGSDASPLLSPNSCRTTVLCVSGSPITARYAGVASIARNHGSNSALRSDVGVELKGVRWS
jgi:hypothetical protein